MPGWLRLAFTVGLAGVAYAQPLIPPPQSYRLSYAVPIDPIFTLADADGLVSRTAELGSTTRLAPGGFFAISIQFTQDNRTGVLCSLPPFSSVLTLILADSSSRVIPLTALPAGMSRGTGCDPLAAVLPRDVVPGNARLLFSFLNPPTVISAEAPVEIVNWAPSLFTPQEQRLTQPYLSGQTVALSVAGLGLTSVDDLSVVVGGVATPALSRDPDPQHAGFDLVSYRMPDEAPEGCYVPVYLRTSSYETAAVFLPKANQPGPCAHPWNLDPTALAALDRGERILTGSTELDLFFSENVTQASTRFQLSDRWTIAGMILPEDTRACRFRPGRTVPVPPASFIPLRSDAGPSVTLVSPAGIPHELLPASLIYMATFDVSESAGQWTLVVPGSPAVASVTAVATLPSLPAWIPPARLDRSQDAQITWSPEGLTEADRLAVVVLSNTSLNYLECRAPGNAGALVLPARYLRALPQMDNAVIGLVVSGGSTSGHIFNYRLISTARISVE